MYQVSFSACHNVQAKWVMATSWTLWHTRWSKIDDCNWSVDISELKFLSDTVDISTRFNALFLSELRNVFIFQLSCKITLGTHTKTFLIMYGPKQKIEKIIALYFHRPPCQLQGIYFRAMKKQKSNQSMNSFCIYKTNLPFLKHRETERIQ